MMVNFTSLIQYNRVILFSMQLEIVLMDLLHIREEYLIRLQAELFIILYMRWIMNGICSVIITLF